MCQVGGVIVAISYPQEYPNGSHGWDVCPTYVITLSVNVHTLCCVALSHVTLMMTSLVSSLVYVSFHQGIKDFLEKDEVSRDPSCILIWMLVFS